MARDLGLFLAALLGGGVALGSLAAPGCDDSANPGPDGGTGQGGQGGCPTGPHAQFTLTITALAGPVPPDTELRVVWMAGEETFVLSDPGTWKTLDDGINVVCDVDHDAPPPTDLDRLVCALWTTGATDVEVTASGYDEHAETLRPTESERCEGVIPTDVSVQLAPLPDGGTR